MKSSINLLARAALIIFASSAFAYDLQDVKGTPVSFASNQIETSDDILSCVINFPLGSVPEGEPDCGPDYVDSFNCGCDSEPAAFQTINSGDTIWGSSGVYLAKDLSNRGDTDWYELEVDQECYISWSAVAEFGPLLELMDAETGNCIDYSIINSDDGPPCDTVRTSSQTPVPPGVYWLKISPADTSNLLPCPSNYAAWVICTPDCSVEMVFNGPDSVSQGDTLSVIGSITSVGGTDVWVTMETPENQEVELFTFLDMSPGGPFTAPMNLPVPICAPLGLYEITAYCGDHAILEVCDQTSLFFTVTGSPCRMAGGYDEWALDGWEFVDDGPTAEIPAECTLSPVYPNPFNAVANIVFGLSEGGEVELIIYNLLGQEVATLVNGRMEAGRHSVVWNAGDYSSGIYFYELKTPGETITRRMTLLK